MSEGIERTLLKAPSPPQLRRYMVRVQTHTGRVLQRRIATFHGEYKAVALACEFIHMQLGCEGPSVRADRVFVEDLGPVGTAANGLYDLQDGEGTDRNEF